ncbi:hypothetical protein EDC04DRAFT_2650235 [Pisolithus marmoratus]|nr:hypothetical protein EDC04DRAFT_2650235 [Pisolithus marmoratus]
MQFRSRLPHAFRSAQTRAGLVFSLSSLSTVTALLVLAYAICRVAISYLRAFLSRPQKCIKAWSRASQIPRGRADDPYDAAVRHQSILEA